ncbi:signal recognition particle receptor subunit beta isoform X2 [Microcaecilia unicolor]|uniref:Signal recognition particle receptor subunit beta n=1 Tax=Microcaecilia unicolor TaxID=1415580 RepID=A0A6P7Z4R6_9AMPH|nr:signal recognition particle receptor subunit beta isoform X2 [Microcaecilia unicolor]
MSSSEGTADGSTGAGAEFYHDFHSYVDAMLQKQDKAVLSVLVAVVVVVVVTLVFWKLLHRGKSSRRDVLLIGLCDSGKTLLFSRGTSLTLVDLPGHESLRLQFLERFKTAARAIVFVVDSAAFQREVKDVAELLYQLLTDNVVLKNAPPLLIACNKQDVTMAKSAKLIQQQLEKELNTLRVTHSAAPTNLDGSGAAPQLGRKSKEFDFTQLPMKVEFLECSARDSKEENDANLSSLEKWLAKIA